MYGKSILNVPVSIEMYLNVSISIDMYLSVLNNIDVYLNVSELSLNVFKCIRYIWPISYHQFRLLKYRMNIHKKCSLNTLPQGTDCFKSF